jgi:hypothetical protein
LSGVITASTREVLETYSKIPPAEVDAHIYAVVSHLCAPGYCQLPDLMYAPARQGLRYPSVSMHWRRSFPPARHRHPQALP